MVLGAHQLAKKNPNFFCENKNEDADNESEDDESQDVSVEERRKRQSQGKANKKNHVRLSLKIQFPQKYLKITC